MAWTCAWVSKHRHCSTEGSVPGVAELGKFAADRVHWGSSFGGCFCLGLVCLRPVHWFSSLNCSFCLMRRTLSSSLTAHALSWPPCRGPGMDEHEPPGRGGPVCVLGFSFIFFFSFCHIFLTDLHVALVDLQRLCAVSCVAHSMNWRIKRLLFHHFCSAFFRSIHVMCCDCFRCACVKYISEIPLCIFNTSSLPSLFSFISRIPLRATIVPKAS